MDYKDMRVGGPKRSPVNREMMVGGETLYKEYLFCETNPPEKCVTIVV